MNKQQQDQQQTKVISIDKNEDNLKEVNRYIE